VLRTGLDSELGFTLAALAWSLGAMVVTDWETRDLPHLLERQPPGLVALTPVQLSDLLRVLPPGFEPRPAWRFLVSGGLLAPAVAREARLRLTPDVQVLYGAPETGRVAMGPAARLEQAPGAAGWPLPGVEIAIVGPDGGPAPDGEAGEIRIRSDRAAPGYLDDPAATAEAFADGVFRTGDLGRRLADGGLVVEGRLDERMDVQGVRVLPSVLENALLEHPGVRDAAAVTLPDAKGLDECWVAVAGDRRIARSELLVRLTASGARVPPVRFAWTEAIPRDAAGKVDREALRAQLTSALGAAGA
jgi:acyl-coenzyme A synthetase/AMP-(fatty) acid ligase